MSFQAPRGVSEYVPPRSALFEEARGAFAESARRACYASVETAVFEDTSLFVRGVGESSDVVVTVWPGAASTIAGKALKKRTDVASAWP